MKLAVPRSTLAVVLALFMCACGDSAGETGADAGAPPGGLTQEQAARVVARVGDETITLGDYASALDRMDPFDRLRYQTVEKRRELLKEMVDLELLAMEAKRRGLDKRPEAQMATRQILRDAILEETRKSLPTPTEIPVGEVKAFYEANIENYREPERRRVAAIVIDDEAKAKEVLEELKKDASPTSWGKLFFDHSKTADAEKKNRIPLDLAGELGMVGPPADPKGANSKVPEAVRGAAFKIDKSGEVFPEVVGDGSTFYIVRLAGRVPPHERTFAEAEPQIRTALLKQRMKDQESKLEAELRQKYKVEIDEAALANVSERAAAPMVPEPTASSSAPDSDPAPAPSAAASGSAGAPSSSTSPTGAPTSPSPSPPSPSAPSPSPPASATAKP